MTENRMSFSEILDEISNKKMLLVKTAVDKDVTGFDALRECVEKRIDTYKNCNKTFDKVMQKLLNATYNDFIEEKDIFSLITMKQITSENTGAKVEDVASEQDLQNTLAIIRQLAFGKKVSENEKKDLSEKLEKVEEILVERLLEEIMCSFDEVITEAMDSSRIGDGSYNERVFKELWTLQKRFSGLVNLSEAFGFNIKSELEKMDKPYVYKFAKTNYLNSEDLAKYKESLKKEHFYSLAKIMRKNKK